jgi:hypothetical protein
MAFFHLFESANYCWFASAFFLFLSIILYQWGKIIPPLDEFLTLSMTSELSTYSLNKYWLLVYDVSDLVAAENTSSQANPMLFSEFLEFLVHSDYMPASIVCLSIEFQSSSHQQHWTNAWPSVDMQYMFPEEL